MQKRRMVTGVAALLMGVSLVFPWTTSAHNIDLDKAREVARDFARAIRQQSNGNYIHYSTRCVRAFPGHNHVVRCAIEYQNAKDTKADVYTCKEMIEIKFVPHGAGNTQHYTYNILHTSGNKCGGRQPGVEYAH